MRPTPSATTSSSNGNGARQRPAFSSLRSIIGRLVALMIIDAFAFAFAYALVANGAWVVAALLVLTTAMVNVVFLVERLYPWRWIAPGFALLVLMTIYPVAYTGYIAFTNYGDGHLLNKQQAVTQIEGEYFTPEGADTYSWSAYRSSDGEFLLYLRNESGEDFVGAEGEGIEPADDRLGQSYSEGELPQEIEGYQQLQRGESIQFLPQLQEVQIEGEVGEGREAAMRIISLDAAALQLQRYTYDLLDDTMTDNQTDAVYEPEEGVFVSGDGEQLRPGFASVVGWENFQRVFTERDVRVPFVGVFIWTFVFAGLSVLTTFALGVALALLLNDRQLPGRGVFRSLMIVPYTIPPFITALVWVGLMNPNYGPINEALEALTGVSPSWFSDGTLAKAAIIFINLWLGFPYMMIIGLGALQAIPDDLYEAARIDGAGAWSRFRFVTLPMLVVAMGPVLIGTFAFNFNNFTIIELVTQGGPPNPGVATPAGQTDILISYTFRLAFAGGEGVDYGLAAAISVFIFLIIAVITAFNFRFTRRLEEV